jgi:phage-related baseplate assembly protein
MNEINIIESLSYDEILADMKSKMQYELLESDPAARVLEITAYRELILRERINNAAKANLLAFAAGSDLDYLAEFYGIERQANETDDAFRLRIKARIAAFSNAGSKEHYRFHALSSSPHIKDALASSPENGLVRISILADSEDGTSSSELLEIVRSYINRDDIKMLTDTVEIVGCQVIPVDIVVEIRSSNSFTLSQIKNNFISKFNSSKCLGWSPSISWIIANLFTEDVTHIRVLEPSEDINVGTDECVTLNSLSFL